VTREHAILWAERLALPSIVQRIVRGASLPGELASWFAFPEEFYLMSDAERAAHGWQGLVALWDTGNFDEVVAYWPEKAGYLRFYVEGPVDLATATASSWQRVLVSDFIRLYEADVADETFREYARLFGFSHAEDVIAGYASHDLSTNDRFEAWKAALLQRVDEPGGPTSGCSGRHWRAATEPGRYAALDATWDSWDGRYRP
jgi:hypothetical protein